MMRSEVGGEQGLGAISTSFWSALQGAVALAEKATSGAARRCTFDVGARRPAARYTASTPNALLASERQRAYASARSSRRRTTRMPRPPPPPTALMTMPASPCSSKKRVMVSSEASPAVAGITGTLQSRASRSARPLSPNSASCSTVGPTKVMPASRQAWAKSARSLRKPYPGAPLRTTSLAGR